MILQFTVYCDFNTTTTTLWYRSVCFIDKRHSKLISNICFLFRLISSEYKTGKASFWFSVSRMENLDMTALSFSYIAPHVPLSMKLNTCHLNRATLCSVSMETVYLILKTFWIWQIAPPSPLPLPPKATLNWCIWYFI